MKYLAFFSIIIASSSFGQKKKPATKEDYHVVVRNSGAITSDSMTINGNSFAIINVNITSPNTRDFVFKFTGNGKTNETVSNNSGTIYLPRLDCDSLIISSNEYPKIRLAMSNYPYNTIEIKITESTEATEQKKTRRRRDKKFVTVEF